MKGKPYWIIVGGIVGAILFCGQSQAQTAGKQTDLNKANQLIKQLQKEVSDRDKTIQSLKDKKGDKDLKAKLDKANQALADKDNTIAGLRKTIRDLALIKNAPYIHSVVLKAKKEEDSEQVKLATNAAAKTLAKISGVRHLWIGRRADVGSPGEADKDYQVGVVVLLDDADGLKKFLDDPLCKQFNERVADYWTDPVVYDILRDPDTVKK